MELTKIEKADRGKVFNIKCQNGHYFKTTWEIWRRTKSCPTCSQNEKERKEREEKLEKLIEIEKAINAEGFELLSDLYIDNKKYLKFKCPKGHTYESKWNYWTDGVRCPLCPTIISSSEKRLITFLQESNIEFIHQDKKVLGGPELDFYIPSHNLAIEMCGIWWHSEKFKERNYHLIKYTECKKLGIRLITMFEDEWLRREKQVSNLLKSVLGLNNRIMARKCKPIAISPEIANQFLEDNHIQGARNSFKCYGLLLNSDLLMVMSFSKHHRQNCNDVLLSRMCSKDGLTIVGGASKLFKYAVNDCKLNNVATFADLRYSSGEVYEKMGFKIDSILGPDYSYTKSGRRHPKQLMKKLRIEKYKQKTESDLRTEQGFVRIWDCGKIKYRWKRNLGI